jgi:uridine kinase
MNSPEQSILNEIERVRARLKRPVVVALDGGMGAGKSTIAGRIARLTEVALIHHDDFYQTVIPESELPRITVQERLDAVFDWSRVRSEALEPLLAGRPGRWHAFDFTRGLGDQGTYSLQQEVTEVAPAPTIIVEGAYSASPRLRDLIDLTVLVDVPTEMRHARALERGEDARFLEQWHEIWDDVETYYFNHVCPPESFDLVVSNFDSAEPPH